MSPQARHRHLLMDGSVPGYPYICGTCGQMWRRRPRPATDAEEARETHQSGRGRSGGSGLDGPAPVESYALFELRPGAAGGPQSFATAPTRTRRSRRRERD